MVGHDRGRLVFRLFLWGCVVLTIAVFSLVWLYAWKSRSGHTGVPLGHLSLYFLFMAGTGFISRLSPAIESRNLSRALVVTGLLGSAFISFLGITGILSGYEAWLQAGQPSVPAQRDLLLALYAGGFALATVLAFVKSAASADDGNPPGGPGCA